MKTSIALLFGAALAGLAAFPAGAAERTVPVEAFDALVAAGRFEVRVEVGPAASVRLEGSERDLDELIVDADDERLSLRQRHRWNRGNKLDVIAIVTTPSLRRALASQGAQLTVTGVDAEQFEAEAAMGAIARIQGQCGALEASASMGAILDAEELACARAEADASMGAVVRINAAEEVDGEASMGGSVTAVSAPANCRGRGFMGGDVNCDERP